MKKQKHILISVLALAISACVAPPPTNPECRDRIVTVNHRAASLDAHPEYVELCSGNLLTIQLVPPVTVGKAETKDDPDNSPAAPWIAEKNASKNRIVIQVPADTEVATYKYSIHIDGVGTLDPRARVTRR